MLNLPATADESSNMDMLTSTYMSELPELVSKSKTRGLVSVPWPGFEPTHQVFDGICEKRQQQIEIFMLSLLFLQ